MKELKVQIAEYRLGAFPIYNIPKGVYVVGTAILIVQVVCVLPDIESQTGVPTISATPDMRGESWFGVDVTASDLSAFATSQPQPLPKRLAEAVANSLFRSSKLPKVLSMALAKEPTGAPPPLELIIFRRRNDWHGHRHDYGLLHECYRVQRRGH